MQTRIIAAPLLAVALLAAPVNAEDLQEQINSLSERVAQLEQTLSELKEYIQSGQGTEGEKSPVNSEGDDQYDLKAGVYEVGDDIEAGKYSVTIYDGAGYLQLFDSYKNYVETKGNQFLAIQSYDVASPEKAENPWIDYISEIGSLRLDDGMCLVLDEVSGVFTRK